MLEPHTATFPCGSFSRKSGAAVAFQNLDPSINQHPWFTPHNTHTHTLFSLPSSLQSISMYLHVFLSSLFLFSLSFSLCPSMPLSLSALHPSFSSTLGLQPPGHFRQAVCNRFINRLFSVCSKHSIGLGGCLSDTDRLVLNHKH